MGIIHIKTTDNCTTIYNALRKTGNTIYFEKGIYEINRTLYINSNNTIYGNGARLRQASKIHNIMMTYTTAYTTGYNGAHDITIENLEFESMGGTYHTQMNLFTAWHSKNITLKNCKFYDNYNFHAVEINGSYNTIVDSCKFLGYYSDSKADFREQIQIDFSSESAIFLFKHKSKCYDNTCCENIIIKNNLFDKSQSRPAASRCIGNHCQPLGESHQNITIENNTFHGHGTNPRGSAIELISMDNVRIRNNYAEGFGRFCHSQAKKYSYDKYGNKKKPLETDGWCSDTVIEDNKVENPTAGFMCYNYYKEKERI